MPVTANRLRPWVAVAAALGAALTLTSPAAGADEPVADPLAKWTKGASVTVAAGVTRTTWTESTLDNRVKARILQIVEIDPTAGALTLESTVGTNDGSAEQVSDQLAKVTTVTARHPYAGVNGGLFQREPAGAASTRPRRTPASRSPTASCTAPAAGAAGRAAPER